MRKRGQLFPGNQSPEAARRTKTGLRQLATKMEDALWESAGRRSDKGDEIGAMSHAFAALIVGKFTGREEE